MNDADFKYRLIGTRADGTRATVLAAMKLEEAQRARDAIAEARIFASVEIAMDSAAEIPRQSELPERKSAVLFPPSVQPLDDGDA